MVTIVGHRGAEGYAPENTIASFQKAIDLGCHRTELDVRLSSDGVPMVIHDADIKRVTGQEGMVGEYTEKDLHRLLCKGGGKIPTLEEVVSLCAGKIDLQIELKEPGEVTVVQKVIRDYGIEGSVVVSSFYDQYLLEMHNLDPSIKTLWLLREIKDDVLKRPQEIGVGCLGPKSTIVTPEFVSQAHKQGLKVYAYHVNDLGQGKRLIAMGVDEIGTDYPKVFLA